MNWETNAPDRLAVLESWLERRAPFAGLMESIRELREDGVSAPLLLISGEFNAGKSSFINALLGERVLTTDVTPATSVVTKLTYGASPKVIAYFSDGNSKAYPMDWLEQLSAERSGEGEAIRGRLSYIEVQQPSELLKRINIVDSPGFNSQHKHHTEAVKAFMRRADYAFWLFHYYNVGTASSLDQVEEIKNQGIPVYGIVNAIDLHDEEQGTLQRFLDFNLRRGRMQESFHSLTGVSAREALEAKLEGDFEKLSYSNWASLERLLNTLVLDREGRAERFFNKLHEILKILDEAVLQERSRLEYPRLEALAGTLVNETYPMLINSNKEMLHKVELALREKSGWAVFFQRIMRSLDQISSMMREIQRFSSTAAAEFTADRDWLIDFIPEYKAIQIEIDVMKERISACSRRGEELHQEWSGLQRFRVFRKKQIAALLPKQKDYEQQLTRLAEQNRELYARSVALRPLANAVEKKLRTELQKGMETSLAAADKARNLWSSELEAAKRRYSELGGETLRELDEWDRFYRALIRRLERIVELPDQELRELPAYQACLYVVDNMKKLLFGLDIHQAEAAMGFMNEELPVIDTRIPALMGTLRPDDLVDKLPHLPHQLGFDAERDVAQITSVWSEVRKFLLVFSFAVILIFVLISTRRLPEETDRSALQATVTPVEAQDASVTMASEPLASEEPALQPPATADMEDFLRDIYAGLDDGSARVFFSDSGWNDMERFTAEQNLSRRLRVSVEEVSVEGISGYRLQTKEVYEGSNARSEYQVTYMLGASGDGYLQVEALDFRKLNETAIVIAVENNQLENFLKNYRIAYFDALHSGDASSVKTYLTAGGPAYKELTAYISDIAGKGYHFEHSDFEIIGIKKLQDNNYRTDTFEKFIFTDEQGLQTDYERKKQYYIHASAPDKLTIDKIVITRTNKTTISNPTVQLITSQEVGDFVTSYYTNFVSAFNGGGFAQIKSYYDPTGPEFKAEEPYLAHVIEKKMHMENLELKVTDVRPHGNNQYLAELSIQDRYSYQNGTGDVKKLSVIYRVVITPEGKPLINELVSLNILEKVETGAEQP